MKTFLKIVDYIRYFNLISNECSAEIKQKMGLFNLAFVVISPIIVTSIIYLYFVANSPSKAISIITFLIFGIVYFFSKGDFKKYVFYIVSGFLLSTLILISNLINFSLNIEIEISNYIIAKATLITSFVLAVVIFPNDNKRLYNLSIVYNLLIFLLFEVIFSIFSVDFLDIGKFRELFENSYRIIVYILNINIIAIATLLFVQDKFHNRNIAKLEGEISNMKNAAVNKESIIAKIKNERDNAVVELESIYKNKFHFFINWREIHLEKSFAFFEIQFDSQHLELANSELITKEIINTFRIVNQKENEEIKFNHYIAKILTTLLPKYFKNKLDIHDDNIEDIYVNKFKYSLIAKKAENHIISFFIVINKHFNDIQFSNEFNLTSKFHIFNTIDDFVLIISGDGKIIYVNNRFLKSLAYNSEEIMRLYISNVCNTLNNKDFDSSLKKINTHLIEKNNTFIGKFGERISLETSINEIIFDSNHYFILIGRENYNYIKLLKENEIRKNDFNRLISLSHNVIFNSIMNKDWTMTFITENVYELTGYTSQQFISNEQTFENIIHDNDKDYVWNEVEKAVKQNTNYDIKYRIITKQKTIKLIHEVGFLIPNQQNENEILIYGYFYDLNNEIEQKNLVSDLENRFLKVLDNIPTLVAVFDKDGNIKFSNKSFINFFSKEEYHQTFVKTFNLLTDERIVNNKVLFGAIQKALTGEFIDSFEYELYKIKLYSGGIKTLKAKSRIIPYFEKSTLSQMIVFITESYEYVD